MMGMNAAAANGVRADSVALLANECKAGHACAQADPKGFGTQLLVSLRYDKMPRVRLKALEGLQRYVGQDQRVRDGDAGGADARSERAGADGGDWAAGAGAVGLERAAGVADGVDAG